MKYGFGDHDDFKVLINVMFWNVNGFTELVKSSDVSDWLEKNCDICFLSETHMTKEEYFKMDNFKCIHHPYSDIFGKKPRGGLVA